MTAAPAVRLSLQRRATTNLLKGASILLTSKFLMALVKRVSAGSSLLCHLMLSLLTSRNIEVNATSPLP